jgi:hypothetical protein
MSPEQWSLLNAAQAVISKLTASQKRAMMTDDTGFAPRWKGHIHCLYLSTAAVLFRLGLIVENDTLARPTPLGAKVREVLLGRGQPA